MIRRIDWITHLKNGNPSFRLLFLPVGFATPGERVDIARLAWERVLGISPFSLCATPGQPAVGAVTVYCWDQSPPALTLQQSGRQLSIPQSQATTIRDALVADTVQSAGIADPRPAKRLGRPAARVATCALAIRRENDARATLKRRIDDQHGSPLRDEKHYARSAEG